MYWCRRRPASSGTTPVNATSRYTTLACAPSHGKNACPSWRTRRMSERRERNGAALLQSHAVSTIVIRPMPNASGSCCTPVATWASSARPSSMGIEVARQMNTDMLAQSSTSSTPIRRAKLGGRCTIVYGGLDAIWLISASCFSSASRAFGVVGTPCSSVWIKIGELFTG